MVNNINIKIDKLVIKLEINFYLRVDILFIGLHEMKLIQMKVKI